MTTGRMLLLADDTLTRELAYVALSRGRGRNDLYLAVDDHRAADRHHPEAVREPDRAVREAVRQSGAKTMAVDHGPQRGPARPGPSPVLVASDLRHQLNHLERELHRAEQRRNRAQEGLDNLPRFRRADRRAQKGAHAAALESATTEIDDLTASIADKRSQLRQVDRQIDRARTVPIEPTYHHQRHAVSLLLDNLERPRPAPAPQRSVGDEFGLGL